MRIHSVIIVTSGMSNAMAPTRLDHWIEALRSLNKKVVLVFGPDGDDFLLGCSKIEECEIVFDPNFQGSYFSSVMAGLHAVHSPTLVLSLSESELQPERCVQNFETRIAGDGTDLRGHALTLLTRDTHIASPQSPFLVTQKGVTALRALPSTLSWPNWEQVQIETLAPASSTQARLV